MANTGQATGTTLFGTQTSSPTDASAIINNLLGSQGATLAQYGLQGQTLQNEIGLTNQQLPQQIAYNNAMAGYQQAGLQSQAQQIGIQQTGLAEQGAQQAAQQGIEQQQYGLQSGQFPEQRAEAALAYQNALQQTQGGQAISGTQNTVGGKSAISTLGAQYGFQQQDIARAQGLSQLGQQSELSGYGYSQQQLQNAQQNLALNAQANGLSQNQLLTMLGYQNQQAGIGAQQNILGLYGQLGQNTLGALGTAGSALSQLGFAGNINTLAGVG